MFTCGAPQSCAKVDALQLLPGKLRFDLHSANSISMSQEKKTPATHFLAQAGQDQLALALKQGNSSFVELMLPIL